MKENPVKWFGYLFSFAFLIVSCAGTELTQRIVDDTYRGKVSSILVIAVTGSEHHQRAYEKEFVSQLKAVGVDAISSEEVMPMPADLKLEKEMILNYTCLS